MPPIPDDSRTAAATLEPLSATDAPTDWYDRSSLPGDFLVMIAGQTEEDYFRRAPDGQFCEFIDGIVYMPPRVKPEHQEDTNLLLVLISCYHSVRPLGYITTGPAALRLREGCWLEPDLFIVPEEQRAQVRAEEFGRPPVLLVVEVLSPSNKAHDLDRKAAEYRQAAVDEVWFIDRPCREVIIVRREGDDYITRHVSTGPVLAKSLNGFWFDAAWLWHEPPPNVLQCVNTILAGLPGA